MSAREVALQVLRDVFPTGHHGQERTAQESLDYRSRKAELEQRDRAFATELAYGAIKMRRALDWYLNPFVGERKKPPPPTINEILRLGVYEFVYTRADVHATVFEWVNLAKKYGHPGVAGLTNAVLRTFLRERPMDPAPDLFADADEYLGVAHSLPTWLVRQWRETFGDLTPAICEAVNGPAQPAITVNTLRTKVEAVSAQLQQDGIDFLPSHLAEESLLIGDAAYARGHERHANGAWFSQSESSALPVVVMNPQPGETVLDVASGRGNKALQTAARMHNDGALLCIERDARKAGILRKRLEQGGSAAGVIVGDATDEILDPDQKFDRILVDAPCSGTGVVGRHPEARWRKDAEDGLRLAETQLAILERIAPHVHEGGSLVYAVCSTDPHETTEVVEAFLRTHDFSRGLIPAALEGFITEHGDVLVPPGLDGRDGFYIARLEKRQ